MYNAFGLLSPSLPSSPHPRHKHYSASYLPLPGCFTRIVQSINFGIETAIKFFELRNTLQKDSLEISVC